MQKCPSVEIRYKIMHKKALLMPLTEKTGQKKEPRKWLSFYQLVAFRQLFLSFFNLPLQNLPEVVGLRVGDAESLHCLVILRGNVVGDVFVVILGSSGIDVNNARRNLS